MGGQWSRGMGSLERAAHVDPRFFRPPRLLVLAKSRIFHLGRCLCVYWWMEGGTCCKHNPPGAV